MAESTFKRFEPSKEYTHAWQNSPWKPQDLRDEAVQEAIDWASAC